MRKVSTFYTVFYRRQNVLKQTLLAFFFSWSSWPRLVLEVFLRHDMGERYFSLTHVIVIFVVLCRLPSMFRSVFGVETTANSFVLWYLFALVFLGAGLYRKWELRRLPQLFDCTKFSMSTGQFWPWLTNLRYQGKPLQFRGKPVVFSPMLLETVIEPALFFLPGLALWAVGQQLGVLLMSCAVFYGMSYVAAYQMGRDFLLDAIDQRICDQDLGLTLAAGFAPEFGRGVNFPGEIPADTAQRQHIAPAFLDDEVSHPIR